MGADCVVLIFRYLFICFQEISFSLVSRALVIRRLKHWDGEQMPVDQTVNIGNAFSVETEAPSCHVLYVLLPTLVGSSSAYNSIPYSFELFLLSFWLVLKCLKLCYFRVLFFIYFF